MPPPYTLDPDYRAPVAYTKYNDPPPSGRELSSRAGDVQRAQDGGDLPSESVRAVGRGIVPARRLFPRAGAGGYKPPCLCRWLT